MFVKGCVLLAKKIIVSMFVLFEKKDLPSIFFSVRKRVELVCLVCQKKIRAGMFSILEQKSVM